MDADVLVVGAGPTGLMLATQLARRGVSVRIIDRHAGPALQTRALGVQARTLEIYQKLGVIDEALSCGTRGTGATLWSQGRKTARVPLGEAGLGLTPYPYILILGQDDNERILGAKLNAIGVEVSWNTELVNLEQQVSGVKVTLKHNDGTTSFLNVGYVAGCDGARSTVRELCGIDFPGAPYEHVFFVADTEATGTMAKNEVNVYLWREGFHLLFPMRGDHHWRIVGILPENLRNRRDVTFQAVMPSLKREAGSGLSVASCSWFSTYRIQHRAAARFRERRCFLLGDAAHIHSPVGAQGMNTGLQDAYNLAWKLALVVREKAHSHLLDSYEEERIPVAQRLLNTTDRGFRLIVSDGWFAKILRTKVLARVAAFALSRGPVQRLAFRVVSQTGITYRGQNLAQSVEPMPSAAPRAGDRFPWMSVSIANGSEREDLFAKVADTCFTLLLFGQERPDQWPSGDADISVIGVTDTGHNRTECRRLNIPWPSFYLLRPDGHVGLCGNILKASDVVRYLETKIGLTSIRAF